MFTYFYSAAYRLHQFVKLLCQIFIKRLHLERYNTKKGCHTPIENRLSDSNIEEFIFGLKPVIFHMMSNEEFDDERNIVFNILSTIRPDLIVPTLLEKLKKSMNMSLTEPHRLTACLATLKCCSRPLVENYPIEIIQILKDVIPGIDINDVWKSRDILSLMNSLLEMIWIIDFSGSDIK